MDLAKALIRSVVRAFYETKHVLVLDALMVHSAVANDDLAYLLSMQPKDLRRLCAKLRDDRLLVVYNRSEIKEGVARPTHKDYYYIDFHATIDAIKYRVFCLTEEVKKLYKPTEEKKDYVCPQCKAQWTQLEVLDKFGPMGFECHRCGGLLEREEPNAGDAGGHEKQSRLMSQLEGMLGMLQQIDLEDIPNYDFETALSMSVPVPRENGNDPARPNMAANGNGPPASVKGMTQTSYVPLDVLVTAGSEKTEAEKAAEAQRKANIAAQNVLPAWHTHSTVTGELMGGQRAANDIMPNGNDLIKDEEEKKDGSNVLNDELTAYYAQMAQEKEKEAREDREGDDSSGEEDDEFEDVGIGASNVDTPSSSIAGDAKVKDSESGSSAPATGVSTPAGSGALPDADGPPALKKVKFEEEQTVDVKPGKDSDEDEEVEFEDV